MCRALSPVTAHPAASEDSDHLHPGNRVDDDLAALRAALEFGEQRLAVGDAAGEFGGVATA
jgi:hypothetical protein